MTFVDDIKKFIDINKELMEEDKKYSDELKEKEEKFLTEKGVTKEGFDKAYKEAEKNFRLDVGGTICAEGHEKVIEALKSGENKEEAMNEFLSCVETNRIEASLRSSAD